MLFFGGVKLQKMLSTGDYATLWPFRRSQQCCVQRMCVQQYVCVYVCMRLLGERACFRTSRQVQVQVQGNIKFFTVVFITTFFLAHVHLHVRARACIETRHPMAVCYTCCLVLWCVLLSSCPAGCWSRRHCCTAVCCVCVCACVLFFFVLFFLIFNFELCACLLFAVCCLRSTGGFSRR